MDNLVGLGALFITDTGVRKVENLQIQDSLLCVDGTFKKLKNIKKIPYNGKMVSFWFPELSYETHISPGLLIRSMDNIYEAESFPEYEEIPFPSEFFKDQSFIEEELYILGSVFAVGEYGENVKFKTKNEKLKKLIKEFYSLNPYHEEENYIYYRSRDFRDLIRFIFSVDRKIPDETIVLGKHVKGFIQGIIESLNGRVLVVNNLTTKYNLIVASLRGGFYPIIEEINWGWDGKLFPAWGIKFRKRENEKCSLLATKYIISYKGDAFQLTIEADADGVLSGFIPINPIY